MKEMTSEERVLRVLQRKEPDRVPHFEWTIDKRVRTALAPECRTLNEFAVRMGLDAVLADPDFLKEPAGPGKWRSEWGYVLQESQEEHGIEVESPIHTMQDFERYTPPDPHAPGRYTSVEKTIRDFGGTKAVIVHLNDVFSLPRYLMGYENLLMGIAAEPALVSALVTMSVDINLAKQLNVLMTQLGIPKESIAMNLGSAAVGYGFEYLSSTMDRVKSAALEQDDTMLQMPVITQISTETWSVKESMASQADMPEWGDLEQRGIQMETVTAAACLASGSDAVIMRHPVAVDKIAALVAALI